METVSIADIKPNPFQVRQSLDPQRIRELADEIRETGFWPTGLRARQVNGHYELVFGHRRLEALKLLGHATVELEIVELDDNAMATHTLIENLQREGLNDIEKADGIKRLLEYYSSTKKVAQLLGYSEEIIRRFVRIAELDGATKQQAAAAHLPSSAIDKARQLGGAEFVRTAAKHKLKSSDLQAIQAEIAKLKEGSHAKVKVVEQLKSGKLTKPEQVQRAARKLIATAAKANPKAKGPPDLLDVVFKWTTAIKDWREQLKAVAPYRDYLDTEPYVAQKFRDQVKGLIEDLNRLL